MTLVGYTHNLLTTSVTNTPIVYLLTHLSEFLQQNVLINRALCVWFESDVSQGCLIGEVIDNEADYWFDQWTVNVMVFSWPRLDTEVLCTSWHPPPPPSHTWLSFNLDSSWHGCVGVSPFSPPPSFTPSIFLSLSVLNLAKLTSLFSKGTLCSFHLLLFKGRM